MREDRGCRICWSPFFWPCFVWFTSILVFLRVRSSTVMMPLVRIWRFIPCVCYIWSRAIRGPFVACLAQCCWWTVWDIAGCFRSVLFWVLRICVAKNGLKEIHGRSSLFLQDIQCELKITDNLSLRIIHYMYWRKLFLSKLKITLS